MRPIRDSLLFQLRQHAEENISFIVQSVLISECDSRLMANIASAASGHPPDKVDIDS